MPNNSTAERTPGSMHPAGSASFERARLNDVTVAMMLRQNQPLENIVGQLAAEKELYVKRIMELESIAPRKIVMPDGKMMLWQCPAELVPPMMPNEKS